RSSTSARLRRGRSAPNPSCRAELAGPARHSCSVTVFLPILPPQQTLDPAQCSLSAFTLLTRVPFTDMTHPASSCPQYTRSIDSSSKVTCPLRISATLLGTLISHSGRRGPLIGGCPADRGN